MRNETIQQDQSRLNSFMLHLASPRKRKTRLHLHHLTLSGTQQILDLLHIRLISIPFEIASGPLLQLIARGTIECADGSLNAAVQVQAFRACDEVV